MKLSQFETLIRLYVPGAKVSVIDQATLYTIINKGVNDVNQQLLAYRGNVKFDVTSDTAEYAISAQIADFLCMDESGIFWKNGTQWQEVLPKTKKWLDENVPNWRSAASASPRFYYVEQNTIGFHPTPDTTLADGFWVYYIKAATDMSNANHYPFTGSATEITSLRPADDAIIAYVRWKLADPLMKDKKGVLTNAEYLKELQKADDMVRLRPDISQSRDLKMRGVTSPM